MIEMEKLNIRLGTWSQKLAPGFSWCFRCETPWRFVHGHDTPYAYDHQGAVTRSCFPLCEKCWAELTPEQRLPYYRQLWDVWTSSGSVEDRDWQGIEAAVLAGR